jgi:hypothetical protein
MAKARRDSAERTKREHALNKLVKWEDFRERREVAIHEYCRAQ